MENEITAEQKATSWLGPDGVFYLVKKNHYAFVVNHFNVKSGSLHAVINVLMKKGWQRITYYSKGTLYTHNDFVPPNNIQKRKLIDLVVELKFDKLIYDNGKKEKIIWSSYDVLEENIHDFSRTKNLVPLIKLAKQYKTFEDFEKDYQLKNFHGIYWHLTDNPDFKINPTQSPTDLSSMAMGGSKEPGLMVTTDLGNWYETFKKSRKYAALIDLSDLKPNADYRYVGRGFGHEIYVFKPQGAKVIKTYPIKNAMDIQRRFYKSVLPQSQEELKQLYDLAKQG